MKLFIALFAILASQANFAQALTLDPANPQGIDVPVDISLDGPGTVSWNTRGLDPLYPAYVTSGDCAFNTTHPAYPQKPVVIGFTCVTGGSVHLTTTASLSPTCPYDGGNLEYVHLTLKLDGVTFYDAHLWPTGGVCYVTPAVAAVASWTAPVVTFDNTAQAQPSLSTDMRVEDPNWLYSKHSFEYGAGVGCGANLKNVGTRFKKVMKEVGFVCSATVPANSVSTVTVH